MNLVFIASKNIFSMYSLVYDFNSLLIEVLKPLKIYQTSPENPNCYASFRSFVPVIMNDSPHI